VAYKQSQKQKSLDLLNSAEKGFDKIQHPFMIKALKNKD
jgi:hypothetical protein